MRAQCKGSPKGTTLEGHSGTKALECTGARLQRCRVRRGTELQGDWQQSHLLQVAVVLAFLMGAEGFPNWTTVMGGLLMVAGTLVVSVTSRDDADGTHVPIILDGMQGMPHVTQDLVVAANAELATPTAPTTPLTPLTATARQAR